MTLQNYPIGISHTELIEKFRDPVLIGKLPNINFTSNWDVKILPPFGGVLCRFLVNDHVSIYLDASNALGSSSTPYWEIYPNVDNDISRYHIDNVAGLLTEIQQIVDQSGL